MTVKNLTHKEILARDVRRCDNAWRRLRGLLGMPKPSESEAYWLVPCNAIHTIGMKYPVDAYFLNKKKEVVAVLKNLQPNRISPIYFKAHSVLEFASGKSRNCRIGDQLDLGEDHDTKKTS